MTDHPSPDALADLDAGPVDGAVAAHVAGCADCAGDLERIRAMSADLAQLPVEPLPPDIASRIDAALAAERARISAPTTVVPLRSRPRRAVPGWLAAAAAGVALFGGAAFLLTSLDGGGGDRSQGGSLSASRDLNERSVVRSTGSDYRAATLADQLPTLLGAAPARLTDQQRATGGGGVAAPFGSVSSEARPGAEAPKALDSGATASRLATRTRQLAALAQPGALAACLVRALGADVEDPIAVDLARYNGEPAVIVALPALGRTDRVDIYVLDPGCPEGVFVYFARLPLPQPR